MTTPVEEIETPEGIEADGFRFTSSIAELSYPYVHPSISKAIVQHVADEIVKTLASAAWNVQELTDWLDAQETTTVGVEDKTGVPVQAYSNSSKHQKGESGLKKPMKAVEVTKPLNGQLHYGPAPHPEWADVAAWLSRASTPDGWADTAKWPVAIRVHRQHPDWSTPKTRLPAGIKPTPQAVNYQSGLSKRQPFKKDKADRDKELPNNPFKPAPGTAGSWENDQDQNEDNAA